MSAWPAQNWREIDSKSRREAMRCLRRRPSSSWRVCCRCCRPLDPCLWSVTIGSTGDVVSIVRILSHSLIVIAETYHPLTEAFHGVLFI